MRLKPRVKARRRTDWRIERAVRSEEIRLAKVLHQAGIALSATLDFNEVLDRILEQISLVIPYDTAAVLLLDGGYTRLARQRGFENFFSPQVLAKVLHTRLDLQTVYNLHHLVETQQPLVIPDTHADSLWVRLEELDYIASWAGAPIVFQDKVEAILSLDKKEAGFYNAGHAVVLAAFAAQAGLALQNARLFEAVRQRAEEAETLRLASVAVTSALELDDVLDRILVQLKHVLPYDSASVFLLEGDRLHLVSGRGLPVGSHLIGAYFPAEEPLFGEMRLTASPIIISDVRQDRRFAGWGGVSYVRGWLGAPLQAQGKVIGCLTLDNRQVGAYGAHEAGLAQAFAGSVAMAIANARLFAETQRLAITDSLTQLYNRRYFVEVAEREFNRSRRYSRPLSLAMMDIDHFKNFNDQHGHLVGDEVLVRLAQVLCEHVRDEDILARYGGEEFILLMPETTLEKAFAVLERLSGCMAELELKTGNGVLNVSLSFGLAGLSDNCATLGTLIARADQALYLSKKAAGGKITIWSQD